MSFKTLNLGHSAAGFTVWLLLFQNPLGLTGKGNSVVEGAGNMRLEDKNTHKKARHTLRTISTLILLKMCYPCSFWVYTDSKGEERGLRKHSEKRLGV